MTTLSLPSTENTMRSIARPLPAIPSPSGTYPSFAAYIEECLRIVGTAHDLGIMLGFTSGTRVSDWKRAQGGRPSLESCLKLAKLTGDDPLDILTMAGHDEAVELLKGFLAQKPEPSMIETLKPLNDINSAIEALKLAKAVLEKK